MLALRTSHALDSLATETREEEESSSSEAAAPPEPRGGGGCTRTSRPPRIFGAVSSTARATRRPPWRFERRIPARSAEARRRAARRRRRGRGRAGASRLCPRTRGARRPSTRGTRRASIDTNRRGRGARTPSRIEARWRMSVRAMCGVVIGRRRCPSSSSATRRTRDESSPACAVDEDASSSADSLVRGLPPGRPCPPPHTRGPRLAAAGSLASVARRGSRRRLSRAERRSRRRRGRSHASASRSSFSSSRFRTGGSASRARWRRWIPPRWSACSLRTTATIASRPDERCAPRPTRSFARASLSPCSLTPSPRARVRANAPPSDPSSRSP